MDLGFLIRATSLTERSGAAVARLEIQCSQTFSAFDRLCSIPGTPDQEQVLEAKHVCSTTAVRWRNTQVTPSHQCAEEDSKCSRPYRRASQPTCLGDLSRDQGGMHRRFHDANSGQLSGSSSVRIRVRAGQTRGMYASRHVLQRIGSGIVSTVPLSTLRVGTVLNGPLAGGGPQCSRGPGVQESRRASQSACVAVLGFAHPMRRRIL